MTLTKILSMSARGEDAEGLVRRALSQALHLGLLLDLPRLPARRAWRTAMPFLLILRAGGGTGTTLTSVRMRHNVFGSSIGSSRPHGVWANPYSCSESASEITKSGISIAIQEFFRAVAPDSNLSLANHSTHALAPPKRRFFA